ncbi:hypothetical protein H4V97_001334 [Flavobacterium sp. CG_23.5]|uniref:hypothetical protein n=1 Tax=Flavobacterium sp. CG_23.5 TaxID=2760708 RepID=UPI001AE1EBF1|nr:hypothetical protein [Flavobacterium sp. CG_23.5]MBP2283016.1 hypothetical protein [Flavobacterium sp. CG_23.5]
MISKETKNIHWLLFFLIFSFVLIQKKQKVKPEYFYPKNHRTNLPIATPAARVSHSTRGSLPAASAEILTVIFWCKKIRAGRGSVVAIAISSCLQIFDARLLKLRTVESRK